MTNPGAEFQKAIIARLRATDDIGEIVFDRVPPAQAKPYISLGASQVLQDDADCLDGFECFRQVDVWSVKPGFEECESLSEKVRAALHRYEFMIDGMPFEIEHQSTNYIRAGDGLTSQGALSFRVLIDLQQGE